LEPFYLDEPIHVLNFPKHLERSLIDHGFCLLRDLVHKDFKSSLSRSAAEIESQLQVYLKDKGSTRIDFASLIKCVAGAQDKKRAKAALDPYSLGDLITLTPLENLEMKRLSQEKKGELSLEFYQRIAGKKNFVRAKIREISAVLLKPWMRSRFGFATKMELMDRIMRVSEDPEMAEPVLAFISSLYFERAFPFGEDLVAVEEELYAVDGMVKERFFQVSDKASTYFYKPYLRYSLAELTLWLKREFAMEWTGFQEGFIEKALRLSSRFRVRKGDEGVLMVRKVY